MTPLVACLLHNSRISNRVVFKAKLLRGCCAKREKRGRAEMSPAESFVEASSLRHSRILDSSRCLLREIRSRLNISGSKYDAYCGSKARTSSACPLSCKCVFGESSPKIFAKASKTKS